MRVTSIKGFTPDQHITLACFLTLVELGNLEVRDAKQQRDKLTPMGIIKKRQQIGRTKSVRDPNTSKSNTYICNGIAAYY